LLAHFSDGKKSKTKKLPMRADSLTNPMSVPKGAQDAVHVGICANGASCSEQGNQFLMAFDGLSYSGARLLGDDLPQASAHAPILFRAGFSLTDCFLWFTCKISV
jgi:hypothetical protein